MKKCPFCAENIQEEAIKCRFCGEFLDLQAAPPKVQSNASLLGPEKMSEIRRLQRIAGGRPTRADTVRKSKGILYLVIIGAILLYSWNWKRLYENRSLQKVAQSEISFEAFQALFGAASTLSEKEKDQEFEGYKGKTVAWQGKVIYINREGPAPHLNLRQGAGAKALDVVLRFTEKTRTQLTDIREGEQIRYTGKILNFDSSNAYITLNHGMILSVE